MRRIVGTIVGLAVLVLVVLAPALFYNSGGASGPAENTTITSYVADFTVADNGDLTAVETLTVDFPVPGKHGIFRFWDIADPSAPHARRIPHDITVTRDGADEPFALLSEQHGRFRVAQIGSASATLPPGEHVYRISYAIDGVLEPGTGGDRTQFYWNLIPGGWRQPITKSDLTVHLPAAAQHVRCALGAGAAGGCTATGQGSNTLHVTTGRLEPDTPVTVKAGLDIPTPPAGDTRPWTARYDPVLGSGPVRLGLVLLLAVAAAVLGGILGARSREPKPGYPLMYAPPEGIGPAQAKYIFTEQVGRTAYVASIMQAAEKGAIDLDRSDGAWVVRDKGGPAGWASLDPVTGRVAHLLGGAGQTFTASRSDVAAGQRLKDEIAAFESGTKEWARSEGLMVGSGLGSAGALVIGAAFVASLALVIWNPIDMTAAALIPGAFAVCGSSLLAPGSGTRRTRTGRDLWSRVGGFHRVLSTPSSQERFDFSGRKELYTAYIPWAVALGCAGEWAAKYRTEMGAEPPVPAYFAGMYVGGLGGDLAGSMVDDFSSTLDGAISSYQATQAPSGGGGGGFSGGGGGGGGGGGSW